MNEQVKQQLDLINEIDPKFKKKISLNESEAGRIIGVSASSMATYRKQGIGPEYKKFGGRYLYPKIAIAEFMLQTIKTV
jgi:hypothetical protein